MKLKKKCLILALAVAAALFGGCGERDDNDWERADRSHRYELDPVEASVPVEESKPVEPEPVEESKPLHNFNLAKDAVFRYEYDANGELATVKVRGLDGYYHKSPFIIADAEYAEDGNLVSLKAANDNNNKYKLEAHYSTDGRIDSVKVEDGTLTSIIEVTYNDSTGFVYVACERSGGVHIKEELDSSLNITYSDHWSSNFSGKQYQEYYDTDEVAKRIEYYSNNIKCHVYTYYDNGQENEYWNYNKSGELLHHIQYDRSGNILIDEDGNGKPYKR